jgi:hypothetical protein
MLKIWIAAVLVSATPVLLPGCAGPAGQGTHDIKNTYGALDETDRGRMKLMEQGTDIEKAAIERVKEFYKVFSAERINASIADVYALDAYFEDGIRQVKGRDNIKEYFLGTTGAFESCTFDIKDVAVSQDNYYFRWVMHLKLKRDPDNPLELPGMSHVRFNELGLIVFHHDYWETLALFERFPVIGMVISWIKKRI